MGTLDYATKKDKSIELSRELSSHDITGKMLISTPSIEGDSYFDKSVIFILSHDQNGTLGVIINRVISSLNVSVIFKSLQIKCLEVVGKNPLLFGGPIESEKGLILHSADYQKDVLLKINDNLMLSSNMDILKQIAKGSGPKDSLLILGYACWAAGQLENEIRSGKWVITDYSHDIIFSKNLHNKHKEALLSAGIRPGAMIPGFGTA